MIFNFHRFCLEIDNPKSKDLAYLTFQNIGGGAEINVAIYLFLTNASMTKQLT